MRLQRSTVQFVGFVAAGSAVIAASTGVRERPLGYLLDPHVLPSAALLVVTALAVVWSARLTFVVTRARSVVRGLPQADVMPDRLAASVLRTGVERVQCISSSLPIAFCAGFARPEIMVSEGLADELEDRELDAVLLHERRHAQEHEPLVRIAFEAAAQVLFLCPVVRWWSEHRIQQAELRADQAAVREVGAQPVAAALCKLGSPMAGEAAFAGGVELRVAQLLGDPLPWRRPAARTIICSLLGLPFAIAVAGSAIHGVVAPLLLGA